MLVGRFSAHAKAASAAVGVGFFATSVAVVYTWRHISAATASTKRLFSNTGDSSGKKRVKSGLYTKTGDKGTSSLYNGERRSKSDAIFHMLGNNDELNAAIGIAREHCSLANNGLDSMLIEIQSRLFDVGAAVATPTSASESRKAYTKFDSACTAKLEGWVDELDAALPPLKNFVIPSGGLTSTHLNLARTVCRRAERSVVPLVQDELVDEEVLRYLNRLSDFLFAAGRMAAKKEGSQEILWRKGQ
jgi:cob(I)alamin adenosyltransferase